MWLVGSVEEAWEGWLGSHGWSLQFQRDISVARVDSPWQVWGLNTTLVSPDYSTRASKGTQIKSSCVKQPGFCRPERDSWRCREPLKGPWTKFHLQPTSLDSGRWKAEWTKNAWGKSSVGGSRERTEGTVPRIPVLSHSSQYRATILRQSTPLQVAPAWGEAIALPAGITLCTLWSLSQAAQYWLRLYKWLSLRTKAFLWELWALSWPSPRPGAGKSQLWCAACFFLHTNRPSRGSHELWIAWAPKDCPGKVIGSF